MIPQAIDTSNWHRQFFLDHPGYKPGRTRNQNDPDAYTSTSLRDAKVKLFCKECYERAISAAQQQDQDARTAGTLQGVLRTREVIIRELWAVPIGKTGHLWTESRKDACLRHLRQCLSIVDPEIKRTAALLLTPGGNREAGPLHYIDPHRTPQAQRYYSGMPIDSSEQFPQTSLGQTPFPTMEDPYPLLSPQPLSYPMQLPSGPFQPRSQNSPAPSNWSSDSSFVLGEDAGSFNQHRSTKRPRTASATSAALLSRQNSFSNLNQASQNQKWPPEKQREFEADLLQLTASADLAFNWVENPEVASFFAKYMPQALLPSRKVLSNRVLNAHLSKLRSESWQRGRGGMATMQTDGWTGANHEHLQLFSATAKGQLFTIKLYDTSGERKTAENLLAQMEEVKEEMERLYGFVLIAVTTDASGEAKKARKLFKKKYPHLVVPDCYAHQVNLIVGDYFKADTFMPVAKRANELITWLRSKTQLLALLRQSLRAHNKPALSVIRPVPTRWTAYYLAYTRLLVIRTHLELICSADALKDERDRQIIQGDANAKRTAEGMVAIIRDSRFWSELGCVKHHLAPLAIAANITQSQFCRLDDVLLTFGALLLEFRRFDRDASDREVQETLIASLEKRWKASDQDVFIACVIINPFIKVSAFTKNSMFVTNAIQTLFTRLWRRFYRNPPPTTLIKSLQDYLTNEGEHIGLKDLCNGLDEIAKKEKRSPDPIAYWKGLTHLDDDDHPPLVKMAFRLLSICPNSASCERMFSTFGLILTKLRTRLGMGKLLGLAEIKMHLRDKNHRENAKPKVRKRAFGVWAENDAEPPVSSSTATAQANTPASHTGRQEGSDNSSTRDLEQITTRLRREAEAESSDESDDVATTVLAARPAANSGPIKVKLDDIFDSTKTNWVALQQRSAVGSLEDEEEIYDLLDLDAPGEDDLDYDLNTGLESVLIS